MSQQPQRQLSHQGLHAIMDQIATPLGRFRIGSETDAFWIQFTLHAPDYAQGGDEKEWRGRKWRVSAFMAEGEVVRTAFAAVMAAQEHEVREGFKYRGNAIFGPHLSLMLLAAACKGPVVERQPITLDGDLGAASTVPLGTLTVRAGSAGSVAAAPARRPRPCHCAPGFCVERLGGILGSLEKCSKNAGV